ncbi:SDR family NAD(P)-dependent oxidoreductase [Chloroflexota bacterium]
MGKLEGKVALITGSGSGIGRATALLFAKEGAKLMVADYVPEGGNETVKMIKDAGGEASFVEVDVSKAADLQRMVKTTMDTYGRIDILYNNAGIQGPVMNLVDIPEEDWFLVLDTNLNSVFLGSKYTIPIMQKQGGGVIISTSSTMGLGGKATIAAYACAKAGIISLTKTMAAEYGQDNIRVNAVCPGVIYTPMGGPSAGMMDLNYVPQRRWGQPEEIARAVLFLASDDASFVTGVALPVDGGWVAEVIFPAKEQPAQE